MASPDKYSPSVEQKDCPPELKVKLKGKKNEWQDRAKSFNTKSFEEHKSEISDVKKAADTFMAQSVLENITLNADDKALLKYMRTLSVDKPIDISIMQTMLRDVCDKTIAVDGRMGEQTITAMKLAMEKFKSKIPGYQEGLVVGVKIDAVIAPIIDVPSVKIPAKPAQVSDDILSARENGSSISIQEKVDNCKELLKANYGELGVQIDEKGNLFVRQDVLGSSDTRLQKIATIDLSKTEDLVWDNIRVTLEEYLVKQNQKPENTVSMLPITTRPDRITLSPEEQRKSEWQQIQLGIALYAQSKGCEVRFAETDKFTKGALTLNQIYEMKILKDGSPIGSKEFTLGEDNLSTKINPDLAKILNGYVDSAILAPVFTTNTEVSGDDLEKIETDLNNIINQVKEYAKTQGLNLKMEQTFKTHTLLIYNISIQKIHEFTWTEIEKYHGVNLKGKVDIQGEVNEIKTRIDEYIKLEKKRRDKKLFSSVNDQTDNKSQNSFDKLHPEYRSSIKSNPTVIKGDSPNATRNIEQTENNSNVSIKIHNSTIRTSIKKSGSSNNNQVDAGLTISQKQ